MFSNIIQVHVLHPNLAMRNPSKPIYPTSHPHLLDGLGAAREALRHIRLEALRGPLCTGRRPSGSRDSHGLAS